jgi:lipopolysaccharide transport system permease protein
MPLPTSESAAELPVARYDAMARDRISLRAWPFMFRELWAYRELIHRLVVRNFTAQFKQSVFGYLWVILTPLATTLIFSLLRKAQIMTVPMPEGAMPYPLFVFLGTTIWGFFTQLVMGSTTAVSSAGVLVSRIYFPREVLIFSGVGAAFINLIVRLAVLAVLCACIGYVPSAGVLLAPLCLVPLLALGVGLGMLFAPVNTMVHDMSRGLEFVFQFGMFLAPTVYPTPTLDAATSGWQQAIYWLHHLNPVSYFIYAVDDLFQFGACAISSGLLVSSAASFLVFAVGWRFFHACEPLLAERL